MIHAFSSPELQSKRYSKIKIIDFQKIKTLINERVTPTKIVVTTLYLDKKICSHVRTKHGRIGGSWKVDATTIDTKTSICWWDN